MHGTQLAAAMMARTGTTTGCGGGHIINVSSMAAVAPVSGVTLYAAAKYVTTIALHADRAYSSPCLGVNQNYFGERYGCRGFSLAAAKDLAPLGVAVTCLMPDATQTPMVDLQVSWDYCS